MFKGSKDGTEQGAPVDEASSNRAAFCFRFLCALSNSRFCCAAGLTHFNVGLGSKTEVTALQQQWPVSPQSADIT
jgi:hypothetical protein